MGQATRCRFPSIHSILAFRCSRAAQVRHSGGKEAHMKVSSLFVGATLWLALFGSARGADSQEASNQAALMKQSSIVFSGTVSQLGATSFADVPKSAQTIVVRVDSILRKPPAVSLKRGDNVTVEVKD